MNSYDLKITPNFSTFVFEGDISIEFTVNKEELKDDLKKQITLHSKELCYVSASFKAGADSAAPVAAEEIRVNLKATTVTFLFPDEIPATAETLTLSIQFSGFLKYVCFQCRNFYLFRWTGFCTH